jgi:hypothetical protein
MLTTLLLAAGWVAVGIVVMVVTARAVFAPEFKRDLAVPNQSEVVKDLSHRAA